MTPPPRIVVLTTSLLIALLESIQSISIQLNTARPACSELHATRRMFLGTGVLAGVPTVTSAAATATQAQVEENPFLFVKKELTDPAGGVAYMEKCIQQEDFAALLEFTKTYDQILRKQYMGKAKKTLEDDGKKVVATRYANGVTFDLVGINRNSRPGKEDAAGAAKYLQELRDDVEGFLSLQ